MSNQTVTITNADGKNVLMTIQSDAPGRLADVIVHQFTALDAVKIGAMLSCAGADLAARQASPAVVAETARAAAEAAGATKQ
jgi:hypothetical protein